jgi:hypothetical protein
LYDELLQALYTERNTMKGRCKSKVTRIEDGSEALGIHGKIG